LKDFSAVDKVRAADRNTVFACRQGMGTLIAKLAEGIPVALSTPATRLDWGNRDVTVDTPSGRITARAAIITVSTGALMSGNIKFASEMPKRVLDAASKLSLGSYDHIALQIPGNPMGLSRDDVIVEQSTSNKTALLLANIGGSSLCSIDVGGSFGRDLSSQGEAAMVAFAKEWLANLFGSDVVKAVKKSSATRWNASPYVLGAISAAAPGGQGSRKILTEPIGAMFLAGEATHETLWGTVDGAWESGERAADAALRRIGAIKDNEPVAAIPAPHAQRSRRRAAPARTASPYGQNF
jgi:monoamine oxidase